jgi:hypothetical protein
VQNALLLTVSHVISVAQWLFGVYHFSIWHNLCMRHKKVVRHTPVTLICPVKYKHSSNYCHLYRRLDLLWYVSCITMTRMQQALQTLLMYIGLLSAVLKVSFDNQEHLMKS